MFQTAIRNLTILSLTKTSYKIICLPASQYIQYILREEQAKIFQNFRYISLKIVHEGRFDFLCA